MKSKNFKIISLLLLLSITISAVSSCGGPVSGKKDENPKVMESITGILSFAVGRDGGIIASTKDSLIHYDKSGKAISTLSLKDVSSRDFSQWDGSIAPGGDESIYLLDNSSREVLIIDSNNRLKDKFTVNFPFDTGSNAVSIKTDGRYIYAASTKGMAEPGRAYIMSIDTQTHELKEIVKGQTDYGHKSLLHFDVDGSGFLYYLQYDGKCKIIKYDLQNSKIERTYELDKDYSIAPNTFTYSKSDNSIYFFDQNLLEIDRIDLNSGKTAVFARPSFAECVTTPNILKMEAKDGFLYAARQSSEKQMLVYDIKSYTLPKYSSSLVVYGCSVNINNYLDLLLAYFRRIHPDIEVKYQMSDADRKSTDWYMEFQKQLNTKLYAGDDIDVIILPGSLLPLYAVKGAIADMDSLIKEHGAGYGSNKVNSNFLRICTVNNKVYGLPLDYTIRMYGYSDKILGDAKLSPPDSTWRWDDFLAMGDSFKTDKNKYATYEWLPDSYYFLRDMISTSNVDFVDINNMKSNFDSKEFKELLTLAKNIYNKDLILNEYVKGALDQNRNILFHPIDFSYSYVVAKDSPYSANTVRYINKPSQTGNAGVGACDYFEIMTISQKSKQKEIAYEFINLMYSDEVMFGRSEYGKIPYFVVTDDVLESCKQYARRAYPDTYEQVIKNLDLMYDPESERIFYAMLDKIGPIKAHNMMFNNYTFKQYFVEQANRYFKDEISLDEACANIHQKAQFILSEIK